MNELLTERVKFGFLKNYAIRDKSYAFNVY